MLLLFSRAGHIGGKGYESSILKRLTDITSEFVWGYNFGVTPRVFGSVLSTHRYDTHTSVLCRLWQPC